MPLSIPLSFVESLARPHLLRLWHLIHTLNPTYTPIVSLVVPLLLLPLLLLQQPSRGLVNPSSLFLEIVSKRNIEPAVGVVAFVSTNLTTAQLARHVASKQPVEGHGCGILWRNASAY